MVGRGGGGAEETDVGRESDNDGDLLGVKGFSGD